MRWNGSFDALYSPRALTQDEIWHTDDRPLGHACRQPGHVDAPRRAPLVGIPLMGWDLYNSDNRWRTGVGDAFGMIGGGLGGMLGGPSLVGTLPGALVGSYAANQLGLGLYDTFSSLMDASVPRRGGAPGAW